MRLFEAMKMGVAPVIVSDELQLPAGPRWEEFAIRVPEKHADELERIVASRAEAYREMGCRAQAAYRENFHDDVYFNYLVDCVLDIQAHQRVPEAFFWQLRNPAVWMAKYSHAAKAGEGCC